MSEIEKQIVLLNEQLAKVESRKFLNSMVDRWSDDNFAIDRECFEEIEKIKSEIERLEKEIM